MTAAEITQLTPEAQQHDYLEALFHDLGGYIDSRTIFPDGECVRKATSGVLAIEKLLSNGVTNGRNVYVGRATRRSNSTAEGAGDKKHLHTSRTLWADFDYKAEGDAEALTIRLESFPFPPSMRVASGGGEHVYWFIEPFDLSTEANRFRFECVLKGFADYLHADQNATDSTRVMRVPGTTNYPDAKKQAKGRVEAPSVLLEHHPDRVYSIDDSADFEARGKALHSEGGTCDYESRAFDGVLPESVVALLQSDTLLASRWKGGTALLPDKSASGLDMSIADLMAVHGIEGADIEAALRFRRNAAGESAKHDGYFTQTVNKARDWAAKQRAAEPAPRSDDSDSALHDPDLASFDPVPERSTTDVIVTRVADVKPEKVSWLWHSRIPLGKVTVEDGDPGLGKSTVSLDLAARVSTGRAMPDGTPGVSGGALILSAEDDIGTTIRPRLEAAGADLDRVGVLEAVRTDSGERLPELPLDLTRVEEAIVEYEAALVIIDPLMAFLSGTVNAHRDQDVRRALAPMAKMAERTGAAVLVIRHLNKAPGGNAVYRGGGSIGIIGAARSGLLIAQDPDDPDRRVLAVTKSNLAAMPPALGFQLIPTESGAVAVDWLGSVDHTAGSLLAVPLEEGERSQLEEAKDFLREFLAEGEQPVKAVQSEAKAAGVSVRTLERGKAALGVRARKSGFDDGWVWALPTPNPAKVSIPPKLAAFGEVGGLRDGSRDGGVGIAPEDRQECEDRQAGELGGVGGLREPWISVCCWMF